MKIILVPNWVENSLTANSFSLKDVLKQDVLNSILSREDVAFYLYLNRNLTRWLPEAIVNTFSSGDEATGYKIEEQVNDLTNLILGYSIGKQSTVTDTAELFSVFDSDVLPEQIAYKLESLNGDTLVVLPRKDSGVSLRVIVNGMLSRLSEVTPFEKLVLTPLFKYFIKQM